MARVTGIGGIFFRARDPQALATWYQTHLGIAVEPDGVGVLRWPDDQQLGRAGSTVWAPFPQDTTYFDPTLASFMINYRVTNLDEMLAQLRAAGVPVDDRIEEHPYGRFGWAQDPEGNRFELWEPTAEE